MAMSITADEIAMMRKAWATAKGNKGAYDWLMETLHDQQHEKKPQRMGVDNLAYLAEDNSGGGDGKREGD